MHAREHDCSTLVRIHVRILKTVHGWRRRGHNNGSPRPLYQDAILFPKNIRYFVRVVACTSLGLKPVLPHNWAAHASLFSQAIFRMYAKQGTQAYF
jgi:hypothetical protein